MADLRTQIIREICDREGHGELLDVTSDHDEPHAVFICDRDCATTLHALAHALTLGEVAEYLKKAGYQGDVKLCGTIEVRR